MPSQNNPMLGVKDCPTSTVWFGFLEGRADSFLQDKLSEHLESCAQCLLDVERLSLLDYSSCNLASLSPFVNESCCIRLLETLRLQGIPSFESQVISSPSISVSNTIPERIGRFEIRSILGAGGFGRVFLADDPLLKRTVAIKAPNAINFRSEQQKSNFLNEARQVASLDYPGIVPVYDVIDDEDLGSPVIVMKYIRGQPLSELLRSEMLKLEDAVRFVERIALAVHYAHQQGVIHRDLKPSNILIDEARTPFVTDFGLSVNLFDSHPGVSRNGGTPQYMSPEQVNGSTDIDSRTDIWSLGVILAELVHRKRPFSQKGRDELFHSIVHDEPEVSSIPQTAELDAVVRRCLAKKPSDRFATCEELASTLSRWLRRHFPVGVEKWRFGWRRKVLVAFAITLSMVVSWATWYVIRIGNIRTTLAQLEASPPDQIAWHIDRLRDSGATIKSVHAYPAPINDTGRLRLALASIVLGDRSHESAFRLTETLEAAEPEEIAEVVETLIKTDQSEWFSEFVLNYLKAKGTLRAPSMPMSAALAGLNPLYSEWTILEKHVADQILTLSEADLARWLALFDPIGKPRLAKLFRHLMDSSEEGSQVKLQSTRVFAHLYRDDVSELTSLIQEVGPSQLNVLLARKEIQKPEMIAALTRKFDQLFQEWRPIQNQEDQSPTIAEIRMARLAISLFILGKADSLLEAIQHRADPTLQSLVIHGLAQQKISPEVVLELLREYRNAADSRSIAIRFGLLQILALLDLKTANGHNVDWSIVRELWLGDADCGVHSAARLAAIRIGIELETLSLGEHGNWRVDAIGSGTQDFVIIEPGVFQMGILDPSNAKLGVSPWPWHLRLIPRQFGIATTEVTIRQFRDLLPDFPIKDYMLAGSSQDSAMVVKSLDSAYQYCNRVSEEAGYESCYELVQHGSEKRWEPKNNHLELSGYRLPTDGEWELACRAGTSTSRYFGNADHLMASYGWLKENLNQADRRQSNAVFTQRVARFLPNRLGIFDLYGNAKELCDMSNPPNNDGAAFVDAIVPHDASFRRNAPLLRGCSYLDYGTVYAKSHSRTNQIVISTDPTVGFRLARTIRNTNKSGFDGRGR
jgi:serine/threonine protein kinase/formylglycine-generating enzyme required for sulfatase activity